MRHIMAEGLSLEPQVVAHAEEMFVVLSDPAIYQYENQPPESLEWLRGRYAKLASRQSADGQEKWLNWVVRLPTSELIGYVQATVRSNNEANIAYEFSSAYWGRDLAHQSAQVMMAELRDQYGVRGMSAVLQENNHRSKRLLERLGFKLALADASTQLEPGEILMQRETV